MSKQFRAGTQECILLGAVRLALFAHNLYNASDRAATHCSTVALTIFRRVDEDDPSHGRVGSVPAVAMVVVMLLLFLHHVASGAMGPPIMASIGEVGVPFSIRHLPPVRGAEGVSHVLSLTSLCPVIQTGGGQGAGWKRCSL